MKKIIYLISVLAMGFHLQSAEVNTNSDTNSSGATEIKQEQSSTSATEENKVKFTQEQLDQALAPVALYPDSLLAQLLMAATYPDQAMEAAKWSKDNPKKSGDEAVKAVADKNWDSSVASLVAFPQVLEMMSNKPEWVKSLGDMFLEDPDAVMATIQKLRHKAKEEGNLKSTKEQKVVVKEAPSTSDAKSSSSASGGNNTTIIEIQPANPETVYVPVYNPTVVYGSWWYPSHPPYYYHPPHITPVGAVIGFGVAVAAAHCLWSHWDWRHRDINIDIHRHNNVHINRKININSNRASWRQSIRERNPRYTNINNRINNGSIGNRNNIIRNGERINNKTRDVKREQLKRELNNKGINLDKERENMLKNRDQINKKVDRANIQRDRMATPERKGDRMEKSRDVKRDRAAREVNRATQRDRAENRPNRDVKRDRATPAKTRESRPATSKQRVNRPNTQRREINRQPRASRPSTQRREVNRPARAVHHSGGGLRNR